jgi:hypothetical protein
VLSRFERAASPDIPKWFDLPLAKPLVVFVSQGADDSEGHPPFSYEWYVDEETDAVYFLMVMGDAADDGFGIPQNQGRSESGG